MVLNYLESQKKLEKSVRVEIDKKKLWKHVEYLCGIGEKFSGTPEEKKACDYFVEQVKKEGVPIDVHEFEAYISWPSHDRSKDAELTILEHKEIKVTCQSHAMSASTKGIEKEIVDLGPGDLQDYEGKDVKGKIVLVDFAALWAPERLLIAQEKGAAGQITISGDPVIHDMVVTSVWGTPTRESAERIPRIPIVSVTHEDGLKLRALCKKGLVKARMKVKIWKGWPKILLPVVTIPGAEEPDKYFLIHGHYCSWGQGMTDNVGGNAQFIEMTKIFWKHRKELKRGVKIAWWPGHSMGRYAGSTWFVDNNWEDLNKNCIGQMNIDSPGVTGATDWVSSSSSELTNFNRVNMAEYEKTLIKKPVRISNSTWVFRAGDQSFTGIGVARIGCNQDIPEDSPLKGKTTGGGAGGWWWHTLQDTIDKGDKDNLAKTMEVNMTTVLRILNAEVLPFNFEPVADDYLKTLNELQEAGKVAFDLSSLIEKANELKKTAQELEKYRAKVEESRKGDIKKLNNKLMKLSRILMPAYCVETNRFDQDPATHVPPMPRLQPIRELVKMDQKSDEARFLKTSLMRERNKMFHALTEAEELMKAIQK